MDTDSRVPGWLLLLTQLPKTPSSARVALWRRLRAAGAATLVNSAWVLPESKPHAKLLERLRDDVFQQGGTAFVLPFPGASPKANEAIIARFRADRAREYDEFTERCTALLAEIDKETRARKFTFAEVEEEEQELEKLARWLVKIEDRDFFPDARRKRAAVIMARCRSAVEAFSQAVYAAERVTSTQPLGGDQAPDDADSE